MVLYGLRTEALSCVTVLVNGAEYVVELVIYLIQINLTSLRRSCAIKRQGPTKSVNAGIQDVTKIVPIQRRRCCTLHTSINSLYKWINEIS